MTDPVLLTASNLGIIRGERVLMKGLSLSVNPGDAVLLRGVNGAGKSTLLRMLAGLTRPETGTYQAHASHWVGHRPGLKRHETPYSHLSLWATAWGVPTDRIAAILDDMTLAHVHDVRAEHLSAGQLRRTALARTQLIDRPLWLLDEPFTALDDAGRAHMANLIETHRAHGGGLIAAVHGDVPVPNAETVTL